MEVEIICAAYESAATGRRVALRCRPKVSKAIGVWVERCESLRA